MKQYTVVGYHVTEPQLMTHNTSQCFWYVDVQLLLQSACTGESDYKCIRFGGSSRKALRKALYGYKRGLRSLGFNILGGPTNLGNFNSHTGRG